LHVLKRVNILASKRGRVNKRRNLFGSKEIAEEVIVDCCLWRLRHSRWLMVNHGLLGWGNKVTNAVGLSVRRGYGIYRRWLVYVRYRHLLRR